MKPQELIKRIDEARLVEAIVSVEARSSAEIRVCISHRRWDDVLGAARDRFRELGMDLTADRNGVLLFFAPATRQFAIWGDIGVHARCGPVALQEIVDAMTPPLREGAYTEAVVLAISRVGDLLVRHFPRRPDDVNELPDAVVGD